MRELNQDLSLGGPKAAEADKQFERPGASCTDTYIDCDCATFDVNGGLSREQVRWCGSRK